MNPERWRQIDEVLQAAIDRPKQERALFVKKACEGDDELIEETTSLLNAFDDAGDFLEEPAITRDARVLADTLLDVNIGRIIGPYKIVERLGAGGMGEVYLAEDARLGRLVALKILPPYFVLDQNRLLRFQREARAASALNHPNIFTIHEVGEVEGVHYIATEFIDGLTLSEAGATRELTIKEILDIAVQVASALAAAHAAGIIHRDVKPENIMIRSDGIVKVLDFGIAKLTEQEEIESPSDAPNPAKSQTETGVIMGTPRYMSPEQARGIAVDEGTDIWSFGVVLFEMITGRSPFACTTRMDTLEAILEREPPPLNQFVSEASDEIVRLQQIINKALRKERSERYRTAAEMLTDLNGVKQGIDLAVMLKERPGVDTQSSSRILHRDEKDANVNESNALESQKEIILPRRRRAIAIIIVSAFVLAAIGGTLLYRRYVSGHVTTAPIASPTRLYTQMNEAEQLTFIREQEQRVSAMMGDRPVKLSDEALDAIKQRIDRYVTRIDSGSDQLGKENLEVVYARALPFIPLIKRSFSARKVPVIIGIYLPMIESEYKTCFENESGSKGLFQFLPRTAKAYGVSKEEMCDADKMAPAAAHFIADRMAELGDDSQSMTLVLLSYNFGDDGVRDMLRELRGTDNFERNFWTLFANRNRFSERFQNEGSHYVPSFFAAAIIGENPQSFGLQTPPLSTVIQMGSN